MRARHLTVAAALFLLIGAGQTLGAEPTAAGRWQSLDEESHQPNAWFLIRDTGGLYDGTIVRMFMKPGEDPNVVCDKCKDDRRGKPWLGLNIIRGMKRNGAEYTNGTILDPRDGDLYSAMMTLTPDGQTLVCSRLSRHFTVGKESILDALARGCLQRDRSSLQSPSAASSWPQGRRRDEVRFSSALDVTGRTRAGGNAARKGWPVRAMLGFDEASFNWRGGCSNSRRTAPWRSGFEPAT